MSFKKNTQHFFLTSRLVAFLDRIKIPTLSGITLFELLYLYGKGIVKGTLTLRAAAISWALFFSLFPFIIFMFTVLPYLPHYAVLETYLYTNILPGILPKSVVLEVIEYIKGVMDGRKYSLFNVSVLLSILFSTNGVNALINGFNLTYLQPYKKRSAIQQYFLAFSYTILFTLFFFSVLLLVYYSQFIWKFLPGETLNDYRRFIMNGGGTLLFVALFFIEIVILYSTGPKFGRSWKALVPGAILTTLLFVATIYLFGVYINNFSRYNLLYGSIGTVMIMMLWLYINVIIVLVGYELNVVLNHLSRATEEEREQMFGFSPFRFSDEEKEADESIIS